MNAAQRIQAIALLMLAVMVAFLTGTFVWSTFRSTSNHQALVTAITDNHKDYCQSQNTTLTLMADLLTAAQASTDTNPSISPAKKVASDVFVNTWLTRIGMVRC